MDKVVILTGGTSGIGGATVRQLRAAGCRVYEFSRRGAPDDPFHTSVDVTDDAAVKAAADAVFEKEGRIPAIRVSIRRNKAIDWLLETANVTVSDTPAAPAEEAAKDAEEKKPAKKRASKKAAKAEDAEAAEPAAEGEEPKKATRKRSSKKAAEAAADGEAAEAEEKPAPKKRASKKAKAEEQADEAAGEQA